MKKWFVNLNIRSKFLYCFVGITITFLLVIAILLYSVAANMILDQTIEQSQETIRELSLNIDHYFNLVQNSFEYIASNNNVQAELTSTDPFRSDGKEVFSYFSIPGQIRRLLLQMYSSVYMNDINLYGYNGASYVLQNGYSDIVYDEAEIESYAKEGNGKCVFYNDEEETGHIHVAKLIKDSLTMEPIGILQASIKVSYLDKMTEKVKLATNGKIILLDNNRQAIINDLGVDTIDLESYVKENSGAFIYTTEEGKYWCVYQVSSTTHFILIGLIPVSYIHQGLKDFQRITAMVIVIGIIVCFMLSKKLAKLIVEPIEKTSVAMRQFADGDFTIRLPEGRTDEIGNMNTVFNHTIVQVETLLKKVVGAEAISKDMEFKALQAQINPHFLYNVLDTINWMARKKGEENICHMVTAISNLMRGSISNKKSMVPLKEEMNYVRDYIYIQETRYKDRFNTYFYMEEKLNEFQIPKMTIQTLVENAIVHGVENATWECELTISIEKREDRAFILIKDTGVGIEPEKLKNLMEKGDEEEKTAERTHTNLGLYAVKQRLNYVYNGQAQIEIVSELGKGTEIRILLPLGEMKEGDITWN